MQVWCLGPGGSYSHLVAQRMFPDAVVSFGETFFDVIEQLQKNHDAVGILPIENSITSNVHENVDHIFNERLYLRGEAHLRVQLHLLAPTGSVTEKITTVVSHPKAIAQCQKLLKKLQKTQPNLQIETARSTAEARVQALAGGGVAGCLGGSSGLDERLEILESNVGDATENFTRFVVVGARNVHRQLDGEGKITAIFRTRHETGALAKILTKISDAGGNLSKIESRPVPGTAWEYAFWVDVLIDEEHRQPLLDLLKSETKKCRVLGVYASGDVIEP